MSRNCSVPIIPTLVTLFRIICIFPIVHAYQVNNYTVMTFFIWCGLVSDLLDGWAARWLLQESLVGALLDPLADKLFMATVFTMFTWGSHLLPVWFWCFFIGKELLFVGGAVYLWRYFPQSSLKATIWGKCAMVLQSMLVVLISFHLVYEYHVTMGLSLFIYLVSGAMGCALYFYSAQFIYRLRVV